MYSPEKPFPVYCKDCWWSDKWNTFDYQAEYNWDKPFFEQFRELLEKVPRPNLIFSNAINCDYCNYFADGRNCYLCFGSIEVENCLYGSPYQSKDCVDTHLIRESELCYESMDGEKLYQCFYVQDCSNSINLFYCFDCKNCQECIGCVGLRNKSYHIFNQPYSKEDYQKKKSEIFKAGSAGLKEIALQFGKFKLGFPRRYATILQSYKVSGDHIVNSKNSQFCFDVKELEDSKYCARIISAKDIYDTNYCEYPELCYEHIGYWKNNSVKFTNTLGESNFSSYSDFCVGSSSLFACIGLRNKSYCILNKQYTKEEYESLVPKIIKHMNDMPYIDKKGRVYKYGEFFPPELSPFAYNETIAQEYFPLTKEEAIEKGYSWKDPEPRNYQITLKSEDISDHIKDITDGILNQIIQCAHAPLGGETAKCNEQCTQAFRIIPQELDFLRKMSLPLPRLCPNCRHYQRIKQRNPLKLWHRGCECEGQKSKTKNQNQYTNTADHMHHKKDEPCLNEFETTYAPERPEIVYCEACYLREVV